MTSTAQAAIRSFVRQATSLDDLLAALPVGTPSTAGGSNATCGAFSIADENLVLKYVRNAPGTVDGHDSEAFAAKSRQLQLIRGTCPGLRPHLPEVIADGWWPDGAAMVMPGYDGREILDCAEHLGGEWFRATLGRVISTFAQDGYARWSFATGRGRFRADHLDRVHRRVKFLEEHLGDLGLDRPWVINGTPCRPLLELLDLVLADVTLQAGLDPVILRFPAHGDMNLGNVLILDGSFVVLDPRGSVLPFDPAYDLAKQLFSLVVFHDAMRDGLVTTIGLEGTTATVDVAPRSRSAVAAATVADNLRFYASLPALQELFQEDPGWLARTLAILPFHALADAACRISDRKDRAFGCASGFAARYELAHGFLAIGHLMLERIVSERAALLDDPLELWARTVCWQDEG